MERERGTVGYIVFLCFVVAIYSMAGFFTKLASSYDFLSWPYLFCLCGVLFVLGLYAILWQVALKKVPLNRAYLYRSLGLPYGLLIAYFAFHERITLQNLVGCAIVLCGLFILMSERKVV